MLPLALVWPAVAVLLTLPLTRQSARHSPDAHVLLAAGSLPQAHATPTASHASASASCATPTCKPLQLPLCCRDVCIHMCKARLDVGADTMRAGCVLRLAVQGRAVVVYLLLDGIALG